MLDVDAVRNTRTYDKDGRLGGGGRPLLSSFLYDAAHRNVHVFYHLEASTDTLQNIARVAVP